MKSKIFAQIDQIEDDDDDCKEILPPHYDLFYSGSKSKNKDGKEEDYTEEIDEDEINDKKRNSNAIHLSSSKKAKNADLSAFAYNNDSKKKSNHKK